MSGNGFASSIEILNLADQLKPMKKVEVERVVQQLVQRKWLCEVGQGFRDDITTPPAQGRGGADGRQGRLTAGWRVSQKEGEYSLHIRSILELEQYIFRHYPESARKCHICHSLSVQNQVCEACGIVLHCSCLSKCFQAQPEPRCPHCKQFWPHQIPDLHPPSQLPSSARKSRKASRSGSRHQH
uniref:RING-type domain-containing protein n=1 Tax=Micrurus paraensis TaxID=1970185 RepID=A0A2D4L0D2_9SAUR